MAASAGDSAAARSCSMSTGGPATDVTLVAEHLPPGLVNLGNSCYVNSVLQTLAASPRFCTYVRERTHAVQYGMSRIQTEAALKHRPRCWRSSHPPPPSPPAAAAAARGHFDQRVMPLAAAATALDAAATATARLAVLLLRALCRTALWLQGWEPPPPSQPPPQPQPQPSVSPSALQPLAAAAVAATATAATATATTADPGRGSWHLLLQPPSRLQRLAASTLLLQLDTVLQKLQPSYSRANTASTVAPAAVAAAGLAPPFIRGSSASPVDLSALLAALRDHIPGSVLRLGQQNDAAEALAWLSDSVEAELAAWYMLYGRWMQSPLAQFGIAAAAAADSAAAARAPEGRDAAPAAGTAIRAAEGSSEHGVLTWCSGEREESGGKRDATVSPHGGTRPGTCSGQSQTEDEGTTSRICNSRNEQRMQGQEQEQLRNGLKHMDTGIATEPSVACGGGTATTAATAATAAGGSITASGPGSGSGVLEMSRTLHHTYFPSVGTAAATTTISRAVLDHDRGKSLSCSTFVTGAAPASSSTSSRSCCGLLFRLAATSPAQLPPSSPLRGLLSTTSTCCECGGMSVTSVEPFWSLPLPLPPPPSLPLTLPGPPSPPPPPLGTSGAGPAGPGSTGPRAAAAARSVAAAAAAGGWADTAAALTAGRNSCAGLAGKVMLRRRRQGGPLLPSRDSDAGEAADGRPQWHSQSLHLKPEKQQQSSRFVSGLDASGAAVALPADAPPVSSCNGGGRAGSIGGGGGGILTLRDCLSRAVQPELVEGVACCRCSLTEALRRARSRQVGSAEPPPPPQGCEVASPSAVLTAAAQSHDKAVSAPDPGSRGLNSDASLGSTLGVSARSCSCGRCCCSRPGVHGANCCDGGSSGGSNCGKGTIAGLEARSTAVSERIPPRLTVLERQLDRLEALLSGPHLPDLDLDSELAQLTDLMMQQHQQCTALAAAPLPLASMRTRALRRTRVARCPPVLVLQLLRTVWNPWISASVKDGRHVAFPLVLGVQELELLGATAETLQRLAAVEGEGPVEETQGTQLPAAAAAPYVLMAVVVHYGGPESGHYLMYRRIATVLPYGASRGCAGAGVPATATSDTREHGCSSSSSSSSSNSAWLRVSDSSVSLASEWEVLQQAAAVLLYEQQ